MVPFFGPPCMTVLPWLAFQVAQSDFQTGFWETSAATGENIRDCFTQLAHAITDINNPQLVRYSFTPSQSYEVSLVTCHMGSHATQVNRPLQLTPARGRYSIYPVTPEGWRAELTQVTGYIYRDAWFTHTQTATHLSTIPAVHTAAGSLQ